MEIDQGPLGSSTLSDHSVQAGSARPTGSAARSENILNTDLSTIGVGLTDKFSLRVAAAVLTRLHLDSPRFRIPMIVMERKAISHCVDGEIVCTRIQVQPLGGAIRLLQPRALLSAIGAFNWDCEKSRDEQDFRIQVKKTDWPAIQSFCAREFRRRESEILETSPMRELLEEFQESLGVSPDPSIFRLTKLGISIPPKRPEGSPGPRQKRETVRFHNVVEVRLSDAALIDRIVENASSLSNQDLIARSETAALRNAGVGRATALIVCPFELVRRLTDPSRNKKQYKEIPMGEHMLAEHVSELFAFPTKR